ncbi:LysM peptidoglycan-binding domain-containing protein [Thiosulfativibrio zosterae]|uniref:LysM peptidoglycan-binding domain-containing protein n=1 Tax=Thiosulfativibrio zosterae TaxID=2675053 RepID=UPI001A9B2F9A|nr:LysM peptidoglycan-binding domain-containing protein [Thiosulfativibrio zosterae]
MSCSLTLLSACQTVPTQTAQNAISEPTLTTDESPKLPILDLEIHNAESDIPEDLALRVLQNTQQNLNLLADTTPEEPLSIFVKPTEGAKDLWPVLSERFFITPANTHNFQDYLNYYTKNPNYLTRISDRARPYLYFILQEVKSRQMPYEVALLPVVESGFQPYAKSYQSAAGLWQFMPNTGEMFGLERNWWYDGRQDIHRSTEAALNYLQQLYVQNEYDWLLALASYNAGYGNVLKAKRLYLNKNPNGDANFWNIRKYLPKETQHYVPQLLAVSYLVKHRQSYQITLNPIENHVHFEKVNLSQQVDFISLAKITGVAKEQLKLLNAGYLQPTTPPKGPFEILLPVAASQTFKAALDKQPEILAVQWTKHVVKKGESLSVIAEKYKTRAAAIQRLNEMKNTNIRVGKTLLIPVPVQYAKQLLKPKEPVKYQGSVVFHKVKTGESLWTIARYYDITTKELCQWNNIGIREPLYKGQNLKIRSNQYGKQVTYTLKNGDSLWTVAQKYKVSTNQLARWNQISEAEVLQPGQKISVWVKS